MTQTVIRHVSVCEAKAHFSQLLADVETTGSEVIITRYGKEVAKIVRIPDSLPPRIPGMWAGKWEVPDGWDEFTEEDERDWYSDDGIHLLRDLEHRPQLGGGH